VYSPAELALLYADPDPDLADIWKFLTHSCLRIGEFVWLLKDDVIFDGNGRPNALQIRRKKCPQTGQVWQPKHKLNRIVSLTDMAAEIVAKRLATSKAPWLFQAPDTTTLQPGKWGAQRLLLKLHARKKAVGVTHGTLHTFRHTGGSFMANDPVSAMPLALLQKFLGHRRIVTTQVYLHARADDIRESLLRVDFERLSRSPESIQGEQPQVVQTGAEPAKK
jgi:integrase